GEDVTSNVRTMRSVPLSIPAATLKRAKALPDFEVRGEVIMPLASFQRMNDEREERGLPRFANPRNAAAGTIRVLEPNIVAQRRLDYFAYFCLAPDGSNLFDTHSASLEALAAAGFKVNLNWKMASDVDAVLRFISEWEGKRDK